MSSEWVLVSKSCDCYRVQNGVGLAGPCDGSCQPPIPRVVWDAMVERGARALTVEDGPTWNWHRPAIDAALRAALGNPTIEETYEE